MDDDRDSTTSDVAASSDWADDWRAGLLSCAFWLTLLVAACLYAAATLGPKVVSLTVRQHEALRQAARAAGLAADVEQRELEMRAFERDAEFVAARARQGLRLSAPGEILIPAAPASTRPAAPPADAPLPPLWPQLRELAENGLLRARLLTTAAALVLFGFTFLHDRRPVPRSRAASQ
ncbi:MAG: hypothetical protein KF774_12860 [Planctomyces sp.]|nr:hypothetical protein [Planctomyces sp.]